MGRIAKLRLLQETTPVQLALMPTPGVVSGSVIPTGYPAIYETWPDFWRVLRSIPRGGYLGIDFEYGKTGYPYLIGIASETEAVSLKPVPAELQAMDGYAKAHDLIYVAHSYNADKPVLERVLGYKTELSRWEDSLIWHWYAHGNLAKAPDKSEDTSEAGSLGLQDLWSAASLVVDIPNWKTCVTGGTQVLLESGKYTQIRGLVTSNFRGNVKCLNDRNELVIRPVLDTIKVKRGGKKLYRLSHENQSIHGGGRSGTFVTGDHEILTLRGWVPCDELTCNDKMATSHPSVDPSKWGFLVGMILGDSHRDRDLNRFSFFNTTPQVEYLEAKRHLFSNFKSTSYVSKARSDRHEPLHVTVMAANSFWRAVSRMTMEELGVKFNQDSLALWYLDDGYRSKDGLAEIACSRFTQAEAEFWAITITATTGIECKVRGQRTGVFRIVFDREASKQLFELAGPYTPPSMRYKLDANIPEYDPCRYCVTSRPVFFDTPVVEEVSAKGIETVYCLVVAEFENFITPAGVVHNCRGSACEGPCPDHWKAGYNAVDAWTGLKIAQAHKTRLLAEGFPLETFQRRMALAEMCYMREREGIKIDVPRMAEVIRTGDEARNALFPPDEEGNYTPFNPRSAEQVVSWARANSVSLADNTKTGVLHALERTAARYGLDLEGLGKIKDLPPVLEVMWNLHQFKSGGKSPEAWFGPKYRDAKDFIHPRFVHTGTSMGRLSSSRPNATNIPSHGFAVRKINGQKVNTVKACIIPSSPELEIVEADSGQLELRTVLWCAGVDVAKEIKTDAFMWLCDRANGAFDKAAAQLSQSPRDFAKRISHAASYLEGIKVLTDTELSLASTQHAISIGALRVYCKAADPRAPFDWYYRGGWVAFTGANLAEAMFGNKTNASRKLALDILEDIYFANFRIIRRWQKTVTDEIEAKHRVTLATGQFLDLDGTPEEDAKMGAAYYGQGTGAIYAQGTLRRMYEITNRLFLLQVHDSQVYETPRVWTDRQIKEFFVPMFEEIPELPGFRAPGKVNRGPSYGELRQIWDSSKEPL